MRISKVKEAVTFLLKTDGAPTPFIKGRPGIGKSQIIKQIANQSYDGNIIDCRLSQFMSEDLKGIPKVDLEDKVMRWFSPDVFPLEGSTIYDSDSKGILFFDEINRAMPDVLQAVFQLVLDKCIGEKKLLPGWKIVCAGNLGAEDGTNVNDLDTALINRFSVLSCEHNLDDFLAWGKENLSNQITGFVGQNPECLYYEVEKEGTVDRYITPRSWEFLNNCIKNVNDRNELINALRLVGASIVDHDINNKFIGYIEETFISGRMVLEEYPQYKDVLERVKLDSHIINRVNKGIEDLILTTPYEEFNTNVYDNLYNYMIDIMNLDAKMALVTSCCNEENNTILFELDDEEKEKLITEQKPSNNGSAFFGKFFNSNEKTLDLEKELIKIYEKPIKEEIKDKLLRATPKLIPTLEDLIDKKEIERKKAEPFFQTIEEIVEEELGDDGVITKKEKFKKILEDLKNRVRP